MQFLPVALITLCSAVANAAYANVTSEVSSSSSVSVAGADSTYVSGVLSNSGSSVDAEGNPSFTIGIPVSLGPFYQLDVYSEISAEATYTFNYTAFSAALVAADGSETALEITDIDSSATEADISVSTDGGDAELVQFTFPATKTDDEANFPATFVVYLYQPDVASSAVVTKRRRAIVEIVITLNASDDTYSTTTTTLSSSSAATSGTTSGTTSGSSESGSAASTSGSETTTTSTTTTVPGTPSTVTEATTHCSNGVCTISTYTTGAVVVTTTGPGGEVTVYTTYCPLTASTAAGPETTTITITSCSNNACSEVAVPTGLTTYSTVVNGEVVVTTTYCPLSSSSTTTVTGTEYVTATAGAAEGAASGAGAASTVAAASEYEGAAIKASVKAGSVMTGLLAAFVAFI